MMSILISVVRLEILNYVAKCNNMACRRDSLRPAILARNAATSLFTGG
jgi:hypothetical protein